ncbi:MAG: hypothetical protein ACYTHK_06830 [Planctomycetota bacterium]|jgi:hypothetical protein
MGWREWDAKRRALEEIEARNQPRKGPVKQVAHVLSLILACAYLIWHAGGFPSGAVRWAFVALVAISLLMIAKLCWESE